MKKIKDRWFSFICWNELNYETLLRNNLILAPATGELHCGIFRRVSHPTSSNNSVKF